MHIITNRNRLFGFWTFLWYLIFNKAITTRQYFMVHSKWFFHLTLLHLITVTITFLLINIFFILWSITLKRINSCPYLIQLHNFSLCLSVLLFSFILVVSRKKVSCNLGQTKQQFDSLPIILPNTNPDGATQFDAQYPKKIILITYTTPACVCVIIACFPNTEIICNPIWNISAIFTTSLLLSFRIVHIYVHMCYVLSWCGVTWLGLAFIYFCSFQLNKCIFISVCTNSLDNLACIYHLQCWFQR